MQHPDHFQGQRAFVVEEFVNAIALSDHRFQVPTSRGDKYPDRGGGMGADKTDIDHTVRVVDPYRQSILVVYNVEYYATILQDACIAEILFHISGSRLVRFQGMPGFLPRII